MAAVLQEEKTRTCKGRSWPQSPGDEKRGWSDPFTNSGILKITSKVQKLQEAGKSPS
jgi:hypothetical protein